MTMLHRCRTTRGFFEMGIICYIIFLVCIINVSKRRFFHRVAILKTQNHSVKDASSRQLEQHFFYDSFGLADVDKFRALEEQGIVTETELKNFLEENCGEDIKFTHVQLDEDPDVLMTLEEYKQSYAQNYTKKYSNKFIKREISPTLSPTLKPGLNPEDALVDRHLVLDVVEINKELENEKNDRFNRGDDNVWKIPEVKIEVEKKNFKVPNIVHFVWFGNNDFLVHNYMAIIGVWRYQKPTVILFHCDREPVSAYWKAAKLKCGKTLKIVRRSPPRKIYGNSLRKTAHQSDAARLQILMDVGGIYLDSDSVVLKSLDEFRGHDMVIGQPHRKYAAENAIMLANKDSWFLKRWYYEYRNYKKDSWGFNSLEVPGSIAHFFPDKVHVTFQELSRPHWEEIKMIYGNVFDWQPIYVMHLYQRDLAFRDGMPERPLKQLAVLNTTYGEVARHVIWGNKLIRDVTDWIVTCDINMFLEV